MKGGNRKDTIIQSIRGLKFPNMKQLVLWGNNIENIQELSRIYFPNVQKIGLCNIFKYPVSNFITNINHLRKANLHKLSSLNINDNKINQLSSLSSLRAPKFQNILIQWDNQSQCQDLCFLCKIETKQCRKLSVLNSKRIYQKSLLLQLQNNLKISEIRTFKK